MFTDLMQAACDNDLVKVQQLIDSGVDINLQDEDGNTALLWAEMNCHKEMVSLLIKNGADINLTNNMGANLETFRKINEM